MLRENVTVVDCTIRDGGLINDHDFDHRFVREVYKAVSAAGVDRFGRRPAARGSRPPGYGCGLVRGR